MSLLKEVFYAWKSELLIKSSKDKASPFNPLRFLYIFFSALDVMHNGLVENILDSFSCESRAFRVLPSLQTRCQHLPRLLAHRLLLVLRQLVQDCPVIPQVNLSAHEEKRNVRAVVLDFGNPFFLNISEGGRITYGETDKEDVSVWVGERS